MARLKLPDRPLSPTQVLKAARAERAALRKAKQALEAELEWLRAPAVAEEARIKAEFIAWKENQSSRREYLAELKFLRDNEPQTLLAREVELLKTAKSRAKYLATVALQAQNMADMGEPDERDEVQKAKTAAEEALREAKSLAVVVCRRKRLVAKFMAKADENRDLALRKPL